MDDRTFGWAHSLHLQVMFHDVGDITNICTALYSVPITLERCKILSKMLYYAMKYDKFYISCFFF